MQGYDHYAEARRLADMLTHEGLDDWAKEIVDAISEGSTGTEIFMRLRMQIALLLASTQGSPEIISCANRLHKELDSALN